MNANAVSADMRASRPASAAPSSVSLVWIYALLAVLAAMHLSMVLGRSINWDEFWFYSQVETAARGEFLRPLQTIHTRFFYWWLPATPGTEVTHILIARFFMLACLVVTSVGIFLAAETFSDKRTALLSVAAFLGAGYVLQHGTSFRVDPIVTAFLATGFAIAARTRLTLPSILALGAVIGIAAMVTIKFVLWAPAFAGIALWRWQDEEWDWHYPLRWIAAGTVAIGVFGLLYAWHGMDIAGEAASEEAAATLSRSSGKMFGLLANPNYPLVLKGLATALPLAIAAALVPWHALKMNAPWTRKVALIGIWFPVLTPIYYYNAYPYFYSFILPPVAVACAFSIPAMVRRYGQLTLVGIILLSALAVWIVDPRGVTAKQQHLVETVHEIVPEPVNYFDCCGMIGSYPKSNHFLTSWGIEAYMAEDRPVLLETMREVPVPLLIDNKSWFQPAFGSEEKTGIHPEDAAAIGDTFIHYWGQVYLAGRELSPGETLEWDVLVPGTYTVRGEIAIEGDTYSNGDLIALDRGNAVLRNTGQTSATLVWGKNPHIPETVPPEKIWTAF